MKIFQVAVFVLLAGLISSQVVGIDLGTEFWKASLISPGKNLVIVQDARSNRKSYNGIAFLDGIRHFEYDALNKRIKKPTASYFYLNKLIESLDHEPLQGYSFANGTYYFTEGEDKISLEQMVAMILKNIKKYSTTQAGSDIKDVVFSVPSHWGFKARLALVNAASLADLSTLGLITQNSAAAIHFAITRNDTDPIHVGFFNLGSHNLQISIFKFYGTVDEAKGKNIQSIQSISHVSASDVGGLRVDRQLAEYIADQFQAKHKVDLRKNERAFVKLVHKCSDVKETLSANKEANIYIEGVAEGIDLNMMVKREVIESLPIFEVIRGKLQEILDQSGLSISDLHSIEMIGGASRIPLVNKIVKQFFDPAEVGAHINGDESMAFGSALRAANSSITFRVKQLYFVDGLLQESKVVVSSIEDGVISQNKLFDKNSEIGDKREVRVANSEDDLKVTVYYGEQIIHEYILANTSQWKEKYTNESQYVAENPAETVLTFAYNTISVAELKESFVNITLNITTSKEVVQYVEEEDENVQTAEEANNGTTSEGEETNETQTQQTETEEPKTTQSTDPDQLNSNQEENGSNAQETKEKVKEKKKKVMKTKKITKIVEESKIINKKWLIKQENTFSKYKKYTKDQVSDLKQVLLRYEKHENEINERAKVRNDFESTLYRLKDDFENPGLIQYSKKAELQKLKEIVTNELEWMDENAWTASKQDFENHFNKVYQYYEPMLNRSTENSNREKTYNQTIEFLSTTYQKTAELNFTQHWVSEKAIEHLKKINDTVEWIHSHLKKQSKNPLNQNPVFYNHQMIERAEELRDQYYIIKMIPRPKIIKKQTPTSQDKPKYEETINLDDQEPENQDSKSAQDEDKEKTETEDHQSEPTKSDDL